MQNCNKIRGIIKMACYCFFNTVLNKLFHLTDIYIFSTRQNNNCIYKYDTTQKFAHPWLLILCVVSTAVFLFCDSCSSLVPSQFDCLPFFRNPPAPVRSLVFQHLLHIWTLSNSDCMILRSIASHGGQLGYSYTAITKDGNLYACSRRQHNAPQRV